MKRKCERLKHEGFRARRLSAEQGNPSNKSLQHKLQKGGVVMVKNVLSMVSKVLPASLVLIGWITFILGIGIPDALIWIKLIFLSVARVLP